MRKKTRNSKLNKPENMSLKIKQLLQKIEAKAWGEADEIANKLLVTHPNNVEILLPAAEAKFNIPDLQEQGVKLIERAIKASTAADKFFPIVVEQMQRQNNSNASYIAKCLTNKFPKSHIAFELLGVALKRQGFFEEAIKSFKQATTLASQFSNAWVNMGNAYLSWKKAPEALECFEKALGIDSNFVEAMRLKGVALIAMGKNKDAVSVLSKALEKEPGNISVLHDLSAAYYNTYQYNKAIELVRKGLAYEPSNVSLIKISNAAYQRLSFDA